MTAQFPEDQRQVVRSQNEDGTWNFSQVDISELSFKGRFGALAGSFSSIVMGRGTHTFLLIQDFGNIRVGDDVQITSLNDTSVYMWGEVIGSSVNGEGGLELLVYVDDISDVGEGETYEFWEIQVVARPKPGIEKDTSSTSNDPTTGGPWTFTVTAGKFFPIGGTLLIKPTADRTIALIGEVLAYNGTSLTVMLRATNATVSTSYTAWSIALLDSPPAKLPFDGVAGLRLTVNSGDSRYFDIEQGSVRSGDDTTDLILSTGLTKRANETFVAGTNGGAQVRVLLSGTVSSSGAAVTGSGTSFLTDFASSSLGGLSLPRVISTGDNVGSNIFSVTNNTILSTVGYGTLSASSDIYYRGGWPGGTNTAHFGIVVARKDSDGSIDVILSASTPSGDADLPSGYTKHRVIGYLIVKNGAIVLIVQSLKEVQYEDLEAVEAYALIGNNSGSASFPNQFSIPDLTEQTSPTTTDYLLGVDTAASNALKKYKASNFGGGTTFPADMGLITEASTITFDCGTIV